MTLSLSSPWTFGKLRAMELVRRIWKEMTQDRIFDSAAALSYYLMLSFFPFLIFFLTILALISPGVDKPSLLDSLLAMAGQVVPAKAFFPIAVAVERLALNSNGGLLTFGLAGTLWAAASGVMSIMDGLDRAYEVKETRSFLLKGAIAIALTIGFTILAILGAGLFVAGDAVGNLLAHLVNARWAAWTGTALSLMFGLAAMIAGFGLMHYFGPNVKRDDRYFFTPGSVFGILLFLIASFGLSIYIRVSGSFGSSVYGAFGGVIVLLLWLYFLGLAILIGGELNSEIAKASNRST